MMIYKRAPDVAHKSDICIKLINKFQFCLPADFNFSKTFLDAAKEVKQCRRKYRYNAFNIFQAMNKKLDLVSCDAI